MAVNPSKSGDESPQSKETADSRETARSPLDVPCINLNLGREEIVEMIRAGRRKTEP
jgi:hypothetical protein